MLRYTDPSHLFLNGVMDSRRGTWGSLATLHVAHMAGLPLIGRG
jgi:regulator of sirC expression with transglutaminase-like and TPR domain